MSSLSRGAAAAAAAVLALAPAAGRAVDRLVPSQYPTIQAAIDAAGNADQVVVSPGTYRENLLVDGKGCTIRSGSGNPADTIVDGSAGVAGRAEPTVAFVRGGQATLRGFTIRGGLADSSSRCPNMPHTGGGVCVDGASPTIEDNVITANGSCSGGNGIGVWERSSPTIRRNRIVANTRSVCSGGGAGGGGIMLEGGSALVVENLIEGNDCSMDGGGIAATAGTHRIERNVVRDNHTWGFGGALATGINGRRLSLSLVIAGNLFHGNRAEDGTGGLYLDDGTATMAGNTVAQNTGLQLYATNWGGNATCTDDLVDGSVQCQDPVFPGGIGGVITFDHSLVSGMVTGLGCSFTAGANGNLSGSPRFVAPGAKDFHLRPDSPAVNAGVSATALASLDMDGEARTIGASPDIGADEFAGLVAATVSPASHDHGQQKVGTAGPAFTTTIRNDGATPLRVSPVASSSSEFLATTTCVTPNGIAPGASCSVSVTFQPTVKGPRSGTVKVESNAIGSPHAISLSGIGTAPVIALDPPAIDFGDVRTHTTATRTITVTNAGDAPSTGLAVAVQGTALSATNGCVGAIDVGASCTVEVSFAPAARGASNGKLVFTGDGYNLPVEAALQGRGVAPVIQVSAASLTLGAVKVGASGGAPLTISNVGELPLLLSSISTTGEFSQASACGGSVAPGASCDVTVMFTPLDGGTRSGQLRIVHDADGSPTVVPLSGVGQDFSIAAYPTSVSVPSGAVVQMSALVQLEGGWSDPISVSCTGMPSPGRCVLAPAVIMPGGSGLVAVELHTSAATLAALAGGGGSLALAGFLLPGFGLAAGARGARRRRIALLAAAAAAALLAGACSDGGGGPPGGGGGALGPGTYPITIHATSAGVERTATVSLTVTAPYP